MMMMFEVVVVVVIDNHLFPLLNVDVVNDDDYHNFQYLIQTERHKYIIKYK
jgi:hypothetical protein